MDSKITNDPSTWTDEAFDGLADLIYEDLFDPFPMEGREYEDPIEPWLLWKIVAIEKTMVGDKVVIKVDRNCGDVFAILTVYKGDGATWDWKFMLGHKNK